MRYLLLLIPLLFFSCQSKKSPSKSTLRVNMTTEPATFDPQKANDLASASFQFFINEGLTRMEPLKACTNGLAESIDISEDGLTYTFKLRDVYWDEEHPILSYDFVKSFQRIVDPKFICSNAFLLYPIANARQIKEGKAPIDALGIDAPDAKTLIVHLTERTPYFLEIISFCTLFPTPPHDKVSSGAFRIRDYQPSKHIELEKNPHYWDADNVKLQRIHISLVPDEMTAYNMFENHDLDLIGLPFSPLPFEGIKRQHELRYQPTTGTLACTFNTTQAPFDNPHLRKAIHYAIDRAQIVTHVSSTHEMAANHLVPPILSEAIQSKSTPYDIEEAKRHFKLAQNELGPIRHLDLLTPNYQQAKKIGEVIQQQLKELFDIDVHLTHMEPKILIDHLINKEYQMSLCMFFAQYFDAMNVLERLQSRAQSKNYPGWEHPEYVEALKGYRSSTSLIERSKWLKRAEHILKRDCPITPLFHLNHAFLVHPNVRNLKTKPSGGLHLNEVEIK